MSWKVIAEPTAHADFYLLENSETRLRMAVGREMLDLFEALAETIARSGVDADLMLVTRNMPAGMEFMTRLGVSVYFAGVEDEMMQVPVKPFRRLWP